VTGSSQKGPDKQPFFIGFGFQRNSLNPRNTREKAEQSRRVWRSVAQSRADEVVGGGRKATGGKTGPGKLRAEPANPRLVP
jgi:hypothetical protein